MVTADEPRRFGAYSAATSPEDPWIPQETIQLEGSGGQGAVVALILGAAVVEVLADGQHLACFDRTLVRTWLTTAPTIRGLLAAPDLAVCWWFAAELDVVLVLPGTGQYQLPPAGVQLVLAHV